MASAPALTRSPAAIATRETAATLRWPLIALGLVLALQATLVFSRAVNWDEFFYWHETALFADGELLRPLQTIHVRLFWWLAPGHPNSVDGIVSARLFMFACELATLYGIVRLARLFASTQVALLAALAYVSAGYVFQHGTSYRVDPLLTALLINALALLGTARLGWLAMLGFGLLAGLAGMVSIKCVLFLPAFAGIAWLRWSESGFAPARLLALAGCGLAALASFALIYGWHSLALPPANDAAQQGGRLLESSGGWAFFLGIPPYWKMAVKSAATAPLLYGCIAAAPLMIWRSTLSPAHKVALACLWAEIATVLFYTNTAGYYYVFILAPVAVACVLPLGWLEQRYGLRMVALAMLVLAGGLWLTEDRTTIDRQRQLVANVQELFPQGTAYFDQSYMMGAWPKANGFMSPWGMANYRRAGEPAYRAAMEEAPVPLLLANSPELQAMLDDGDTSLLLAADDAAIRDNYVLLSWPIWVAGKQFAGGSAADSEFLVPGTYTLSGGPLVIDGNRIEPGATVDMSRGMHRVEAPSPAGATLTWGDHLQAPSRPLGPGPIHVDF